ncbi:MAG: hydroxymethylpyrimidine/phosphomethylpyrimidine kinase [Steroidobacteraceae bacterium]
MARRPAVLVIAGSDSSGGAGLVRDVHTLEILGADALCAVTAVTAQTDARVLGVVAVPPEQVRAQIDAAFATRPIGAVKIGMLLGRATLKVVADALARAPAVPLVLDPVLRSSSGAVLLEDSGFEWLRARLFPLSAVVTPNLPEAAALCGEPYEAGEPDTARVIDWGRRLLAQGARAVLIKGGHASGATAADLLLRPGAEPVWLTGSRFAVGRRGTGCALASALAAALAAGADLETACRRARAHVRVLLEAAQDEAAGRTAALE